MMTIKVNIPSVDRPQRLEYVLHFAFNVPHSGLDIQLISDKDLVDEMVWVINNREIRLPFDPAWLHQDFVPIHPGRDCHYSSGLFWYFVFFYISKLDVDLHSGTDQHSRWLPPQPNSQWPDRRRPFIDEGVEDFLVFLYKEAHIGKLDLKRSYTPILSVDVDQWYAYREKPLLRNLKGGLRDLLQGRLDRLGSRMETVLGGKDPYDTLRLLRDIAVGSGIAHEMFVLTRTHTKWDRQLRLDPFEVRSLTKDWQNIGLHPSYFCVEEGRIEGEKGQLETMVGRSISESRFHFLRFDTAHAPKALINAGLLHEKSQAIPDDVGFMSGTCRVHPFYDHQGG